MVTGLKVPILTSFHAIKSIQMSSNFSTNQPTAYSTSQLFIHMFSMSQTVSKSLNTLQYSKYTARQALKPSCTLAQCHVLGGMCWHKVFSHLKSLLTHCIELSGFIYMKRNAGQVIAVESKSSSLWLNKCNWQQKHWILSCKSMYWMYDCI